MPRAKHKLTGDLGDATERRCDGTETTSEDRMPPKPTERGAKNYGRPNPDHEPRSLKVATKGS